MQRRRYRTKHLSKLLYQIWIQGVYAIDCSNIDLTLPDDTPKMSAYQFEEGLSRGKVKEEDHFDNGIGLKL